MCIPTTASAPSTGVVIHGSFRLRELVKKIETSRTQHKKRMRHLRKKLRKVTWEHIRIAKFCGLYPVCVTLTFAPGQVFSNDGIQKFIHRFKAKVNRMGHTFPYVWVLECANRIHYHLLVWLPIGYKPEHSVLLKWWQFGSTWTAKCKSPRAWINYITKQETKVYLPAGARAYGCGGLDAKGKLEVARVMLPRWLLPLIPKGVVPVRCSGGWVLRETGEIFESRYIWTPKGFELKKT